MSVSVSLSVSVSVSVSDEKSIYKKIRGAVQTTSVSVSVSESVPSDSRPFRFDRSPDREKLIRTPDSVRFGTGNMRSSDAQWQFGVFLSWTQSTHIMKN